MSSRAKKKAMKRIEQLHDEIQSGRYRIRDEEDAKIADTICKALGHKPGEHYKK